jgi:hypothetical protein
MRCFALFVLVSNFAVGSGAVLRARGRAESLEASLELSGDWAALDQAESENRNFLLDQLDATEDELVKLEHFLEIAGKKTGLLAGLQISATPEKKKDAAKPAVEKVSKDATKSAAKKEHHKEAQDPQELMKSLGIPSLKLKGKAALAPMLAMLKGLYQDSKDRIAQSNTREEKSKKWFAAKEADHKSKLDSIEGHFKNRTLSEEFRTNETRDENRYFNYWSRCRERQHRQFHTNLKIQHAMMMKTKKMIDMYEKTLSDKTSDQEAAKKQLAQATGMPEIVFLQEVQRTVGHFCRESLAEVRKERAELQEPLEDKW